MVHGSINSITRLRIDTDGEGVRSVVFMQGCPLDCFWCCNPETRSGNGYRILSPKDLYNYIKRDIPYFLCSGGGVTFSGGEPLAQADFLKAFKEECGAEFSVDVETSLFVPREKLQQLVPLIDTWNVDFKMADESAHLRCTGASNALILENLAFLARQIPPERIIITYPVIPGYNDAPEQIVRMIAFMKSNGLRHIEVHPYRKFAEEKQLECGMQPTILEPVPDERLAQIHKRLARAGLSVLSRRYYFGKEKCRYLKKLRKKICKKHKLPVHMPRCTFRGECVGVCPQCESELIQIGKFLGYHKAGGA